MHYFERIAFENSLFEGEKNFAGNKLFSNEIYTKFWHRH